MNILVDVRHLSDRHKTGVGEYTSALLRALFAIDRNNKYEQLSSGLQFSTPLPTPSVGSGVNVNKIRHNLEKGRTGERPNYQHPVLVTESHFPLPNKLLKVTTLAANWPRLDRIAARRPDLVWLPNLNVTALSSDTPYVLTIHDLSFKIFPEFFSARMRLWHAMSRPDGLVTNASAIIVPSRATKEDVVRFFHKPADQIHIIPHGVDQMFSPTFTAQDHGVRGKHKLPKRFALFVGTLEPRKNVVALVDAVEAYRRKTGDDLHLVLVGGWGWKSREIRKSLLRYCATALPPSWIHPLGYIPRADLPAVYRAATVFTWPSVYEGFGLPVLEAMASGTPVITSHTSSLPELTGDAAILVNPLRPDEITLALEQLLGSPTLRERLTLAGLARARPFSWEEAARKTIEVFKNA